MQVGAAAFGRGGERPAKEQNAEIGVHSGRRACSFNATQNSCPDRCAGRRKRSCGGLGAREKILYGHSMAGTENMDIAGLRGFDLVAAGGKEGLADLGGADQPAISAGGDGAKP